ncbi:hypothetical protein CN431_20115 [Bacillus cereus]|nr:hypothetical protein CN431_20115 [Bacillus cereus]
MSNNKFEKIINHIKSLDTYEDLQYFYLILQSPLHNLLNKNYNAPSFLAEYIPVVRELGIENNLNDLEIIQFLLQNTGYEMQIMLYLSNEKVLPFEKAFSFEMDGVEADRELKSDFLLATFLVFILSNKPSLKVDSIIKSEKFLYETNDYKLTKVSDIEFYSKGFTFDNKFYLYNPFIQRESLSIKSKIPAVFQVIGEEINLSLADFYLRLDERLAIPSDHILHGTLDFERFRGIDFNFNETLLSNPKNIIVHIDTETSDKLLMVIKKRFDNKLNKEFWHIEVESLPYSEGSTSEFIYTRFVHGMYYPDEKVFTHVDQTINFYFNEYYSVKYHDYSTDIPIDAYTENKNFHYKLWCVENVEISEDTWYKLVYLSLHSRYQTLFNDMFSITPKHFLISQD